MSAVSPHPPAEKRNKITLPDVTDSSGRKKNHGAYHRCHCYGHEKGLPNYKLLAMPRTNNYYAAVGGCPCIPRAAAHPGSWRLKEATLRSSTYRHGEGCTRGGAANSRCCIHSGSHYGYKPGPHTVHPKHTAANGKCDTFGNMAFKSRRLLPDDISERSSVSGQKLEDLEALILEEHQARLAAEEDLAQLQDVKQKGTSGLYQPERHNVPSAEPTEEDLNELLREVKAIVSQPLRQTNMDELSQLVQKYERQQKNRELLAAKKALETA